MVLNDPAESERKEHVWCPLRPQIATALFSCRFRVDCRAGLTTAAAVLVIGLGSARCFVRSLSGACNPLELLFTEFIFLQ